MRCGRIGVSCAPQFLQLPLITSFPLPCSVRVPVTEEVAEDTDGLVADDDADADTEETVEDAGEVG